MSENTLQNTVYGVRKPAPANAVKNAKEALVWDCPDVPEDFKKGHKPKLTFDRVSQI